MPRLWQVSVRTTPQAEQAAADFLERLFGHAPAVYRDEKTGAITVTGYPERLPATQRALRASIISSLGDVRIAVQPLRRENWAHSWKRHFHPIAIGGRLLIKPSWSRRRARPGQRVIILDPGLSFGTGQHPTTLFCLRQLARCRREGAAQSLLDIGTGSGILAIAAAKLGYTPVQALDFDAEAVRACRGNNKRNRVQIRLQRSDLRQMPLESRRRYDVVCANLTADLLLAEAEKIRNRLKPAGTLLVAGVLRREFEAIRKSFQRFHLTLHDSCVHKDWKSGRFALRSDRCGAGR